MPLLGLEDVSLSYGLNHFKVDTPLREVLRLYLNREPGFEGLGEYVGRELYEVAYRVDRLSPPVHVMWDARGRRMDAAWLDPAERRVLEKLFFDYGVNRPPFSGGTWHEHYASLYLVGDPGFACILTITIQTAYALHKYGDDEVRDYYRNLTGLERPLMLGATWFTEVQGGSDLGANQTTARQDIENGRWLLEGYKYFASGAGIADLALATARPMGAPGGVRGLALFLVPRTRRDGSLNYEVTRLKDKSGTLPVPTGEVRFQDSEAHLIAGPGLGVYVTLEDLMVSRLANAAGAVGIARKAYLEAYLYTIERRAFGKKLIEHPLVQRDLLEMEVLTEASLHLTHHAIDLFQKAAGDKPPYTPQYHHARLLTHIVKNITAEASARVTRLAMELFGGLGFLREFPVERWHREALITPIWEGTSNIQALDMLEAIHRKKAHEPFLETLRELAGEPYDKQLAAKALEMVEKTLAKLSRWDPYQAQYNAKDVLETLGYSTAVILLEKAAAQLGKSRLHTVAKAAFEHLVKKAPLPHVKQGDLLEIVSLEQQLPTP